MEKQYRINWKRGLEITPEVLVSSDNYHEAEKKQLGALLASRSYGILPNSKFYIEKEINGSYLIVKSLNCFALTPEGVIISIPKESHFKKELSLKETEGEEVYLILSVNPNSLALGEDKEIYIYPEYNLSVKKTSEPIEFGLPLLKIKNYHIREIDKNFIPPSYALNSVENLLQKYFEINSLIHKILKNFPGKNLFGFHLDMLRIELIDFNSRRAPEEWNRLMKKFCRIFYTYLNNENMIGENQNMNNFMEEPFNPNETGRIFQTGFECFTEINSFFEEKPDDIDEIKL
jgi:hypothetical protein